MAILSVKDLLRGMTRDEALADILVLAKSLGFTASSWRVGSRDRFKMLCMAEVASRNSVQIALIAANSYNGTAWGQGLTNFSSSRFDNTRVGAVKTQGTILLTDGSASGPHTITAGQLLFTSNDVDGQQVTYRNITGGTLNLSGTLEVTVEAESGGSKYNVDVETIENFSPVIAGVSCLNPADPTDWITLSGTDGEPDTSLQQRNADKWSTLGGNAPYNAYDYWARVATTEPNGTGNAVGITRTHIDDSNPGGPGTIYVYIADANGTASAAQVTDVQQYIDARKPRTAVPTVIAATPYGISVVITAHCAAGSSEQVEDDIEIAVADYINGLDIGGDDIGETLGKVLLSRIIEVSMAVENVRRVAITNHLVDISLQPQWVATVNSVLVNVVEI